MVTPSLRRWLKRHFPSVARRRVARRPRFALAVNRLEDRCTPSIAITGLSATPVNENGTSTLTGTLAGASIGDTSIAVDWGDGTPVDTFSVAPGSLITFTRTHQYLDDDPSGTASDTKTITVTATDAGPSLIAGPNTAGYRAYDDSFWRLDMSASGTGVTTILGGGVDDDAAVYDLGSDTFRFYGTNYTGNNQLFASSNGLITFASANIAFDNTALSSGPAQAAIAPFWDDLVTDATTGSVLARKVDIDGNGVNDWLIIEWNDVHAFGNVPAGTFQTILQLNTGTNNGDIVFNYVNTTLGGAAVDYGASATIGIKNSGTADPVQVSFDAATNFARDHNAIRFSAQNINTTALVAANNSGYRIQDNVLFSPGNTLDLIDGNSGVTRIFGNGQDDNTTAYNLGTDVFRFYNTNYTASQLNVSTNGFMPFLSLDATYTNGNLTANTPAEAVICPYWDDLHTGSSNGRVLGKRVDLDGNGTNDLLIIEWSEIVTFDDQTNADNATFQAILELNSGDAPGDIVFNYVDTTFGGAGASHDTAASATIGIKSANSPGPPNPLQLSFNTSNANAADGQAVRVSRTKAPGQTTVVVSNVPPTIVSLTPSPTTINEGQSVTLDGVISDPGTRDTHTVVINWNDGSSNTTLNLAVGVLTFSATHSYADDNPSGTPSDDVSIQVTVSDDDLGSVSGSATVTVVNLPPTAVINAAPATSPEGTPITLTPGVTDPGTGDTFTYAWYVNKNGSLFATATSANFTFTPDDDGTYVAYLTVTDDDTGVATATPVTIIATNVAPSPAITGVGSTSPEGTPLTLTANPNDPGTADTFTYSWTVLKNGNPYATGTASTLNFTPDDNGTFSVSLTVTDDEGGSGSTSNTFTATNVAPTATFTNDGPKIQFSTFTFSFINQDDASPIDLAAGFLYSFDFNNNGNFTDPGDIQNSTSATATKYYPDFGTFVVHGRITDKDGDSTDYTTTVTVDRQGNGGIISTHYFASGAGASGGPHVRLFNNDGTVQYSFFAYDPSFTGGVRVATGDIDGDQIDDIITAAGPGGGPHVKVFSGATGQQIRSFFAYGAAFTGGVWVASADVNNDFWDDIIVGAGPGGGPHVKVFSGRDGSLLYSFFAYSATFTGGVSVGGADVNGDNFDDIITGAGPGGGPHVKVFSGANRQTLASFFAFDPAFTGGVTVSGGDLNGDGKAEIFVGSGAGSAFDSRVRVFNAVNLGVIWDYSVLTNYKGGARVAAEDLNGDGVADLMISTGGGAGPRVQGLNGTNLHAIVNFNAYDPTFLGGVFVG